VIEEVLARLGTLHPQTIDLSLDRVGRLLDRLGAPQRHLPPVVHVAGTNGKGSTIATLRALAEAEGRRVHVYTSPHLVRFAERIRVAGRLPDDSDLAALLEEVETLNDGAPVTFFEITTAAAFLAFARTPADLCLLETGLGGRLDATNLVERPALTVITPIALDHQSYLGDTLEAIAAEKAGILKPGVPCVLARQEPEAEAVIRRRADALGVRLIEAGRDFDAWANGDGLAFRWGDEWTALPAPRLPGAVQIGNAGLALAAARVLGEAPPPVLARHPDPAVQGAALRAVDWPARLHHLPDGALAGPLPHGWELWLDGGHNPHAARALADHLAGWADRPLGLVVGMISTKDAAGVLAPLAPRAQAIRTVAIPGEPLSLGAAPLAAMARAAGCAQSQPAESLEAAIADLARTLPGPARILVCGSLYLAGQVLAANG